MRLVVVDFAEAGACVDYRDLHSVFGFVGDYGNIQRIKLGIASVLYRIFDNGLQGQRGQAEVDDRRVKFKEKLPFKSSLLHRKIRFCVFKLFCERDRLILRDRGEIVSQIVCKIARHLFCFGGVIIYHTVNARQRVVDKVRTYLEHEGVCALTDDLLLLSGVLLHIVREDQTEQDQRKERHTEYDIQFNRDEHMDNDRGCHREQIDKGTIHNAHNGPRIN